MDTGISISCLIVIGSVIGSNSSNNNDGNDSCMWNMDDKGDLII